MKLFSVAFYFLSIFIVNSKSDLLREPPKGNQSLQLDVMRNGWIKETQQIMAGIAEEIHQWGAKLSTNNTEESPELSEDLKESLATVIQDMGNELDAVYRMNKRGYY